MYAHVLRKTRYLLDLYKIEIYLDRCGGGGGLNASPPAYKTRQQGDKVSQEHYFLA